MLSVIGDEHARTRYYVMNKLNPIVTDCYRIWGWNICRLYFISNRPTLLLNREVWLHEKETGQQFTDITYYTCTLSTYRCRKYRPSCKGDLLLPTQVRPIDSFILYHVYVGAHRAFNPWAIHAGDLHNLLFCYLYISWISNLYNETIQFCLIYIYFNADWKIPRSKYFLVSFGFFLFSFFLFACARVNVNLWRAAKPTHTSCSLWNLR